MLNSKDICLYNGERNGVKEDYYVLVTDQSKGKGLYGVFCLEDQAKYLKDLPELIIPKEFGNLSSDLYTNIWFRRYAREENLIKVGSVSEEKYKMILRVFLHVLTEEISYSLETHTYRYNNQDIFRPIIITPTSELLDEEVISEYGNHAVDNAEVHNDESYASDVPAIDAEKESKPIIMIKESEPVLPEDNAEKKPNSFNNEPERIDPDMIQGFDKASVPKFGIDLKKFIEFDTSIPRIGITTDGKAIKSKITKVKDEDRESDEKDSKNRKCYIKESEIFDTKFTGDDINFINKFAADIIAKKYKLSNYTARKLKKAVMHYITFLMTGRSISATQSVDVVNYFEILSKMSVEDICFSLGIEKRAGMRTSAAAKEYQRLYDARGYLIPSNNAANTKEITDNIQDYASDIASTEDIVEVALEYGISIGNATTVKTLARNFVKQDDFPSINDSVFRFQSNNPSYIRIRELHAKYLKLLQNIPYGDRLEISFFSQDEIMKQFHLSTAEDAAFIKYSLRTNVMKTKFVNSLTDEEKDLMMKMSANEAALYFVKTTEAIRNYISVIKLQDEDKVVYSTKFDTLHDLFIDVVSNPLCKAILKSYKRFALYYPGISRKSYSIITDIFPEFSQKDSNKSINIRFVSMYGSLIKDGQYRDFMILDKDTHMDQLNEIYRNHYIAIKGSDVTIDSNSTLRIAYLREVFPIINHGVEKLKSMKVEMPEV